MASRLSPAGTCIYCGATNALSDEHVIPFGLGGDLICPKASCATCAAKTSLFELRVLQGFMSDARLVSGLPTRRKKNRPKTKRHALLYPDGSTQALDLDLPESIGFLHLPTLSAGAFMSGLPPVVGARVTGLETLRFGRDLNECLLDQGANGLQDRVQVDVHAFTKMLSKIAYSYAVALRGSFPRDESPSLAIAMSLCENPSNWIGSQFIQLPAVAVPGLHAIAIQEYDLATGPAMVAQLSLFRNSGACIYEVVVQSPGWQTYENRLCDA